MKDGRARCAMAYKEDTEDGRWELRETMLLSLSKTGSNVREG